jgi:MFS family permease
MGLGGVRGRVLPPVVIGVLLADRLNRLQPRRALVFADLVCAAVFAVLAGIHTPAVVVALAAVAGAAAGIFRPISLAVVPAVVGEERIDSANGTLAAVDTAMTAIGQAGAGAVVAISGAAIVLGANAVSFVISAALLASCGSLAPIPAGRRTPPVDCAAARTIRRNLRRRSPWPGCRCWPPWGSSTDRGAAPPRTARGGRSADRAHDRRGIGRADVRQPLVDVNTKVLADCRAAVETASATNWRTRTNVARWCMENDQASANGLAVVYNRSTVQRETSPEERAGILALLMSFGGVMTAVGAAVGAAVASAASPRAAFAVAGAIVLVSAVAARLMAADEDAAAVGTLSPRAGRVRR